MEIGLDSLTLSVGEGAAFNLVLVQRKGASAVFLPAVWTSRDTSLVTAEFGVVRARLRAGVTHVIARVENLSDSVRVTVKAAAFYAMPDTSVMTPGMVHDLAAETFSPGTGMQRVAGATWSTSDVRVATIDSTGHVVATGLGHATLDAVSDGRRASAEVFVLAAGPPLAFSRTAASFGGTCGLAADSRAYCWGDFPVQSDPTRLMDRCEFISGSGGKAGLFSTQSVRRCAATPVLISATRFVRLIGGLSGLDFPGSVLGIAEDGSLYTISDRNGMTGPGVTRVPGLDVIDATLSSIHTCVITRDQVARCWGFNQFGELGIGTTQPLGPFPSTPQTVLGTLKWSMLKARDYATCGLTIEGQAYCWGDNRDFRLGVGPDSSRLTQCFSACIVQPTAVQTTARFTDLSTTRDNGTCGLTTDGATYCWGRVGALISHAKAGVPVLMANAPRFTKLFALAGPCGLTAGGAVHCLSRNDQATDPASLFSFELFSLPFPVSWISGSDYFACAISAADRITYCWGSGDGGRLGDGRIRNATAAAPARVAGQGTP